LGVGIFILAVGPGGIANNTPENRTKNTNPLRISLASVVSVLLIKIGATGSKVKIHKGESAIMKCRVCGKTARIKLHSHHTAFCREHFLQFFYRRIERTIKKFRMFRRDELVLVAVSGGKDSLALWHALMELGYKVKGFFINLHIKPGSGESEEYVRRFAEKFGADLTVVDVKDYLGFSIPEAVKVVRKPACAVCGMVKRYIMNRHALQIGATAIATGHQLDDAAATLLGNILHWQEGHLGRFYPVLEEEDGFARKVKPLTFTGEYETLAYAHFVGIEYYPKKCRFAHGATSQVYKHILNELEMEMPGTKLWFVEGFFRTAREKFRAEEPAAPREKCVFCGYPTTRREMIDGEEKPVCSFCALKRRLQKHEGE